MGEEKYRQIAEKGTGTARDAQVEDEGRRELLEVILSSTPLDLIARSRRGERPSR
ncbi:MAG: hypothetical protein MZV65_15815 [Chromatiales bacterium]|nr:hypothetical protein [Chromatiales bacterium]